MRFRIWTMLYVFALLAAPWATLGGAAGSLAGLVVLFIWFLILGPLYRKRGLEVALGVFLVLLCSCGLLLPMISTAQKSAQRTTCRGHLAQIAVALQNYHDVHGSFPPAYLADDTGKPIHSWRVLILPMFDGYQGLYQSYRFDEPWDGPNNRQLAAMAPSIYQCPGHVARHGPASLETQYVAIVGPKTLWPGVAAAKLSDVTDKPSQTLHVMEVHSQGIHWMEPRDLSMDEAISLLGPDARSSVEGHYYESLFLRHYDRERNVVFADGHAAEVDFPITPRAVEALCTISGGDALESNVFYEGSHPRTEIRWEGVYAFGLFSALVVLPFPWLAFRTNGTLKRPD